MQLMCNLQLLKVELWNTEGDKKPLFYIQGGVFIQHNVPRMHLRDH